VVLSLRAQDLPTIKGRVIDVAGAAVPNAEVVLKHAGQQPRKQHADDFGEFRLAVPAGEWALEISFPGFQTYTPSKVTVREGETVSLPPIALKVAPVALCEPELGPPVFAFEPNGSERGTASLDGYADFMVRDIRMVSGQRTRIEPELPLDRCPQGIGCKPVYTLLRDQGPCL
jgi:hypothetical protein